MAFEYQIYKVFIKRSNGQVVTKLIDASSAGEAEGMAKMYGKVLKTLPITEGWFAKWWSNRRLNRGFNTSQRLNFLNTLSNMLAGRPIDESLSIMIQNVGDPIKGVCRRLRTMTVDKQMDPIDSLKELGTKYLPKMTTVIIDANAKVSSFRDAILAGVEYEREISQLQSTQMTKVIMAMAWFVFSVIMIVASHLYGYDLLKSFNYFALMPAKGNSVDLLNITLDSLRYGYYFALFFGVIWLFIFIFIGAGRDISPERVESWILKVPILNGSMLHKNNFDACYLVEKLMSKGVSQLESLLHVYEDLKPGILRDDFSRVLKLIDNGDPDWVEGFYSFSDLDRALLKSSNNADQMSEVFAAQANQFLDNYKKSIIMLSWIHWGLTSVIMLVLVFVLSILMFLPMVGGFEMVKTM